MSCDDLKGEMGGGREGSRGGDICIIMTDVCCCGRNKHNIAKYFPPIKKINVKNTMWLNWKPCDLLISDV